MWANSQLSIADWTFFTYYRPGFKKIQTPFRAQRWLLLILKTKKSFGGDGLREVNTQGDINVACYRHKEYLASSEGHAMGNILAKITFVSKFMCYVTLALSKKVQISPTSDSTENVSIKQNDCIGHYAATACN